MHCWLDGKQESKDLLMGAITSNEPGNQDTVRPYLPLLLLLFMGSGCAALIYEIVWFQMLQLVIGSSAVSLGVLLGTFMGGMCLGSLLLPWLLPTRWHPLRVYGAIEIGIGLSGLAVLVGLPYIQRLYLLGHGMHDILLRGAVCGVCLLLPTVLMGATLPAIARWVEASRQGVSWLGFFYGGNIAGAVFGCLLAGFYLLRVHDMATATYVAAEINAGVALASMALSLVARHRVAPSAGGQSDGTALRASWEVCLASATVYIAIALSGATALAAEVLWTRLLSLLMGATVYTFSIILAVFLIGLGIGSSIGSAIARSSLRPRIALAACQVLLCGAVLWTAFTLAKALPYWPVMPYHSQSVWIVFQIDLARCFWAVLPATILWGASFPLALACVARRGQDAGRMVGGVYAANTLGAIVGALAASLWLVPAFGTHYSQRLLVWVSLVAACLVLVPLFIQAIMVAAARGRSLQLALTASAAVIVLAMSVTIAAWAARVLPGVSWQTIAMGRLLPSYRVDDDLAYEPFVDQSGEYIWKKLYVGEGLNSSVAVLEEQTYEPHTRRFHVSGKVEASSNRADMRLQRMLGHLPALVHPNPKSVLIVGCGAGVTAGSFVLYPSITDIWICEIEPLVTEHVADYFKAENYDVIHQGKRVHIVHDDARHFVLTTDETFDIITSDPIHPWVKGSATLYTAEYFEMCKKHLNPGGIVTQWVPLYESDEESVKSQVATFFEVFPDGTVWANNAEWGGYDTVIFGQAEATRIDVDEIQDWLENDAADDKKEQPSVLSSLKDVRYDTAVDLFRTYAAQRKDMADWLEGAQINRDRNLRLQYLAGMQLNHQQGDAIYRAMIKGRRYPENIFVGDGPYSRLLHWHLSPGL